MYSARITNHPDADGRYKYMVCEDEFYVERFLRYLPAGPTEDGEGNRPRAIIQFIARHGGMRTVTVDDCHL